MDEVSTDALSEDERTFGALAHFSALVMMMGIPAPVGPLAVWLLKGRESEYIAAQAKEALNFTLSVMIYVIVLVFLIVIAAIDSAIGTVLLFAFLLVATGIGAFVLSIVAGVKVANRQSYRYPLTIRFVH